MAARRRRKWIAIGGATAAVAIGALATTALGALTGLTAPPFTNGAPQLTWGDDNATATSYDVARGSGMCANAPTFDTTYPSVASPFTDPTPPGNGIWCYRVTGHYGDLSADSAGTTQVMVDKTAPLVQVTSPAAGSVGGTVSINATASDADSGLAGGVVVSVDGLIAPQAPPLAWNTKVLGPDGGTFVVRAHAIDRAGNPQDATITVVTDNTGPTAPVIRFLQNPVTGSPTLLWDGNDTFHIARTSSTGPGPHSFPQTVTSNWTDPDTLTPGTYTYVLTATDGVGNSTPSAPASVIVISPSVTAPQSVSAASPTNTVPHVSWQPPVTFAVTSWQIYRDNALLTQIPDAAARAFDDTGLAAQGPHTYTVQALSGSTPGDMSSPVSVTYDTLAPALPSVTATANPDGSISLDWPAAVDSTPGSGLAKYVVQRTTSAAPANPSAGTTICSLPPAATACQDKTTKNNTTYSYGIFAIDAAGNFGVRVASARSVDTQAPDALAGVKIVSYDRNYARIGWTLPALKDANADVAGYRVLQLRTVGKAPLNPNDGRVVCRNDDPKDNICDVLNLVPGKKVSFAVYAYDGVPNYSPPVMISMTPHNVDNTPPHKPTKVRLTHSGLTYTLRWVSPRDKDLSKFRVTLYDKGPAPRPSKGKAVVTGRVLHATFTLKPGQIVYVNLFALDVSTNFSRVTKLIVAPGKIVPKSKHKVAKKKKASGKTTQPAKPKKS
jgi:hypothetical protein